MFFALRGKAFLDGEIQLFLQMQDVMLLRGDFCRLLPHDFLQFGNIIRQGVSG